MSVKIGVECELTIDELINTYILNDNGSRKRRTKRFVFYNFFLSLK